MNDEGKIQALSMSEVRERLLNKRQDASYSRTCAYPPCKRVFATENAQEKYCCDDHRAKAARLRQKQVLEPRSCAYSKCGATFTPRRVDQLYHCADCRKRAWFESHFMPIPKPEGPS